jgi:hypothetical protein
VEILNEEEENIPLLEDTSMDATRVLDVDISRLER